MNLFKVYEMATSKQEDWKFYYEKSDQKVRQVMWTEDESALLLHIQNTNHLHLMTVTKAKPSAIAHKEDYLSLFSVKDHIQKWANYLFQPLLEKNDLIYNLEIDVNFVI